MKILILTSSLEKTGGIENYNREFIRALYALNYSVCHVELSKSTLLQKMFFVVHAAWRVICFRPFLVIASHVQFSPLAFFLRTFIPFRYVVIIYGIDAWKAKRGIVRHAILHAHQIISISQFTKKIFFQKTPYRRTVSILPCPIDESRFEIRARPEWLEEKYGAQKKKILLCVARLSESEQYKGYDRVIQALPSIIKKIPNILYVLVGTGGDAKRVEALVASLGLTQHVQLTGYVSDDELPSYYNLCDAFIMPSTGEGFGIVYLEALASGKPVIAGNIDASSEPLVNGKLGILVNPLDVDEIARAVVTLFSGNADHQLYQPSFLREQVIQYFGFESFKKKLAAIIDSL